MQQNAMWHSLSIVLSHCVSRTERIIGGKDYGIEPRKNQ